MVRYENLPKKAFALGTYLPQTELEQLYEAILKNLPNFKNKWDLVRFVHDFVAERQGETIATKVAWRITRHFGELFEKGQFVDFYLPRLAFIEAFEGLSKLPSTPPAEPGPQLSLFQFLHPSKGVRA